MHLLRQRLPKDAYCLIAVTETDLRRVLLRALEVMVHEIGHMFGIEHCTHYSCVMDGSNSMAESDSQPAHLCAVGLHELYDAHPFDPKKRYRQLAAFYRRIGCPSRPRGRNSARTRCPNRRADTGRARRAGPCEL